MGRIKIITDSTSYFDKSVAEKEGITIVPLNYVFDNETYVEGFKGEFDEFFQKLRDTNLFPTTSQPSVGMFKEAFEEALKEYDEIIAITISSKLSGTYNSAMLAKNLLPESKITVIDSLTSATNLRFLAEDAVQMAKEGKTSEEITAHIETKKEKMVILITTATLEYLSRGGRLSSVQATLGNLLNIKPIIELVDGELKLVEKVRGANKALANMYDRIPENVQRISVCHILNLDGAEDVKKHLETKFPNIEITVDELGPVLGSHLGPKTIGILFY